MGKNSLGGLGEKIFSGAAPGLIPTGAASLNSLAPAVFEAAERYMKSPSARQSARISRRLPRRVPRPAPPCALQRAGHADRRGPDPRKRDTVLAAVKAWPGSAGACSVVGGMAPLKMPRTDEHRGRFQKGWRGGPGRPKGVPDRSRADLSQLINPSPPSGWIGDLHLQAVDHARHTRKTLPRGGSAGADCLGGPRRLGLFGAKTLQKL
jgi:hypothetical protein